MNKKIIFSLVGLAVVFFITSLIIFLNSGKSSQQSLEQIDSIQEQIEKGLIKVKIFYLNNNSRLMRPVDYEFEALSSMNDIYKKYINMLIQGEGNQISPVPKGLELRSLYHIATVKTLVIDFNEALINNSPGGSRAELEFIYYFVDNICYNFKDIKKVKFIISGNEYKTISGHIDIENPFTPSYQYLREK